MLNSLQPQAVLFDLDGTLVDSVPDLACAVDTAFTGLGFAAPGEDRVRGWVGNGALTLIERALADLLATDTVDPQLLQQAHQQFLFHYAVVNGKASRLYPGVADTLEHLQQQNIPMAVVTNKPIEFVPGLLSGLGIGQYFNVLVGGECTHEKKPSPQPLFYACRLLQVEPSMCLMVGDSKHDIKAAKAAGMSVVAVDYGYNHGEAIALSEPDLIVDCFSAVLSLIAA
ncbi:phosphoglycolate phosphatase [Oceanicoccus sagamiensis]|uniref:phosphoglycolate phosphatase n=1 Tax=Oceanicoccus sagamiensis TaxID=716816 RepID=UPI001980EB27|nr:phosphoglycolate phosphatase [Oceanicoccus sagamiensis]